MRKADLAKNHDKFEKDMDWYIDFLTRMLGAKRVVNYDDKLEILESLVIRLCALWEAFIEGEMIDCLNIDCSKYKEELQLELPEHPTKDVCEAILVGAGYLDFKNVGDIKGFAKNVLPDDVNPFRLIKENPTGKRIDELYIMRNYLSHYSKKSRRTLMKMYQRNPWRLKNFRQPGDFLIAYRGRRLIQYIEALLYASEQMRGIIGS
jgi:hypothetical protein